MEAEKKPSERIIEAAGEMVETYRQLIAINVVEHTSLGASVGIIGMIYLVFISFVLLFVGLASAWWVGETMNNMKAGFFIVSGFYTLVLLLIIATSRKTLIPTIRNLIIRKIYDQNK